ncbi:hypothetical protein [Neotabrizicola sp. VNH66]|uniref:hypothetical protein n=1 Tax=Neotabrizicola sp. VNH66 TaxID=3400918 RepID=UPI003C0745E0
MTRLLLIGSAPQETATGLSGVSQIALDRLPAVADAKSAFLSAVLKSNTVSTFVAGPQDLGGNTGQAFLRVTAQVTRGADPAAGEGIGISLGGEAMSLKEFGDRMTALVGAVAPEKRQMTFFHLKDPEGLFAAQVSSFQQAVAGSGFALIMAEIGERPAECQLAIAPDVALIAGLGDRAPFGDGDGRTSVAEAEAWISAAMARPGKRSAACNTTYALVVRAEQDPSVAVVDPTGAALSTELESQLYRETFEAKFLLGSLDPARIGGFLEDCVYCPNERELSDKLTVLRQEEITRGLEQSIWEDIRSDETPDRLRIYTENCTICAFRPEAERKITELEAKIAAREAEATSFAVAQAARDPGALRSYVTTCIACDHKTEAETILAAIEADAAYQAEIAARDATIAARDRAALEGWLASCASCEGRAGVEALVTELTQAETLIGPCLAAAGLPQQGGPRQLDEIDVGTARAACAAALAQLPQNMVLLVANARIDQAEGRADLAGPVYDAGVAAGLPQAHGLAAYLRFSPADGSAPDVETAAKLAQAGAALDDWLSKEILILLYSRELVPGHTAAEAVELAAGAAAEGNVVAKFFLGYFLQNGIGTEVDDVAAFNWLAQATDDGYVRAQPFLAQMYEQGRAVAPDYERAAMLLWSALQERDSVAITRLTDQMSERPAEVVVVVQQNLRDLGIFTGRADGIAGPGTVRAVRAYVDSLNQQG